MEHKNTKFISYLKKISKNELSDFENSLGSPYYFKISRNLNNYK